MIGDRKYVCKSWGCEEWIVNEEYCGKKIVCVAEWSSQGKYHYHMVKDETFYVTKGSLILDIQGDKVYKLSPGDSFRVKPNIRHRFRAQYSFCEFIEFSTHHQDSDSYYDENPDSQGED